ncbi:MAG: DUF362 domain-containing protein [Candidatus Omnitrophota bacterium]
MEKLFYRFESFLKRNVSRRTILKAGLGGLLYLVSNSFLRQAFAKTNVSSGRPKKGIKGSYDLVVAEGSDPYRNTVQAVAAMGGMARFVKKDAVVVIKPNIAWDRTPEQAANTDPEVVAALVELSYNAGAKRVNVFDIPCNDDRRCYENSGIQKAAKGKGAHVYFANHWDVKKARFSYSSAMEDWPILRDAIECDTFINVPVLKHHRLTGLTLSMKNLMGVCSGVRGAIHMNIGRNLVDLADFINPELTVIDATRVLMKHGPSGGDIKDVVQLNKVLVATDPTLADSFACSLVDTDPMTVPYIENAVSRNIGSADISKANIHTVKS